jgi:hypothetical protein
MIFLEANGVPIVLEMNKTPQIMHLWSKFSMVWEPKSAQEGSKQCSGSILTKASRSST